MLLEFRLAEWIFTKFSASDQI